MVFSFRVLAGAVGHVPANPRFCSAGSRLLSHYVAQEEDATDADGDARQRDRRDDARVALVERDAHEDHATGAGQQQQDAEDDEEDFEGGVHGSAFLVVAAHRSVHGGRPYLNAFRIMETPPHAIANPTAHSTT
jgi:hypothetical protein